MDNGILLIPSEIRYPVGWTKLCNHIYIHGRWPGIAPPHVSMPATCEVHTVYVGENKKRVPSRLKHIMTNIVYCLSAGKHCRCIRFTLSIARKREYVTIKKRHLLHRPRLDPTHRIDTRIRRWRYSVQVFCRAKWWEGNEPGVDKKYYGHKNGKRKSSERSRVIEIWRSNYCATRGRSYDTVAAWAICCAPAACYRSTVVR